MNRPSHEQLIAYAAGELSREEAAAVEAYLKTAPEARRIVERYRAVQDAVARDDSVAPPADAIARAKAIFDKAVPRPQPSWLDRLDAFVSRLVFDSRLQPAAVRFSGVADEFQLAYESDDAEVDLQARRLDDAQATAGTWRLVGQVAADDKAAGCRVAAVRPGGRQALASTSTDDRGMFSIDLETGIYDLCIDLPGGIIVLPGVHVT